MSPRGRPPAFTVLTMVDADLVLRTSGRHWKQVSGLLRCLERCAELCMRFDAYRTKGLRLNRILAINKRFDDLGRRVDQELDRVTSERLHVELARRMSADATKGGAV